MSDKNAENFATELGTKEQEIYNANLEKAAKWQARKWNPWGNGFRPKHLAAEIVARHQGETGEQIDAAHAVYDIAGRIVALRSFGKAAFIKVRDRTGEIQVHVKKDLLGEQFELFQLMDRGDFVQVEGTLFRSKTGELTLAASRLVPVTKALRPLPEKWHGLTDVEIRYRQRYLDLIANPRVREIFLTRSRIVASIRRFLDSRDFIEVETPMMHSLVSGAAARPFLTHHNALNVDLFMRIAPELHLKRLVVGGFERVYEINRNFRNEGISTRHNPEFTMLEFYQAYATYEDLMDLTEEMISQVAREVLSTTEIAYQGHPLSLAKGWKRLPMIAAIREATALSEREIQNVAVLRALAEKKAAARSEVEPIEQLSWGELINTVFQQYVEERLIQPTFITEFPTAVSPLARKNDKNPEIADRFELFIAGREIANAFSELNDPLDQRQRFLAQVEAKRRGREETMDYDEDYIRALEHGLPPTAGEGIGIDRLVMLLTDSPSIRDVILFPLLRPAVK